jgi:hypothetical protein
MANFDGAACIRRLTGKLSMGILLIGEFGVIIAHAPEDTTAK